MAFVESAPGTIAVGGGNFVGDRLSNRDFTVDD